MSAQETIAGVLAAHYPGDFLGSLNDIWTTCSCGERIDATFGAGRTTREVFQANWGAHLATAITAHIVDILESNPAHDVLANHGVEDINPLVVDLVALVEGEL